MQSRKPTMLFLSWRDIKSPNMGGAEIFTHEMMRNSDLSKFEYVHFSPMYKGAQSSETIDGIIYIREGNLLTVIFKCIKYYKRNKDIIAFVVDQCNTFRFFTKFWVSSKKRIFLIFQLSREIWAYHMRFPFNKIGKWLETPMLKLNKNDPTITISESTKKDLQNVGFDESKVKIIPVGMPFAPWSRQDFCEKEPDPTFIYVGRFAKYKGIDACVYAYGEYKKKNSNAKLWIVGKKDNIYINSVLQPVCTLYGLSCGDVGSNADIIFHGFVAEEKKLELMSRAHLLLVPSIREGWGLIVTEAAAVGTPGIVYKSPGLVDAVDNGKAGFIVEQNNYRELLVAMESVFIDTMRYELIRENAHNFSQRFSWKRTGEEFNNFLDGMLSKQHGRVL